MIVAAFLVSFNGYAQKKAQWGKPLWYTAMLFTVEFTVLTQFDLADNKPHHKHFESAFKSSPKKDDDNWVYNRLLHPLMGSETYLRAREAHFGIWGSFWFSMGASFVWEYLIESWTEHPSSEDLIYTTGIGWMVGEMRYNFKKLFKGPNYWILDPINSLITHMDVKFRKRDRKLIPYLAFNYQF